MFTISLEQSYNYAAILLLSGCYQVINRNCLYVSFMNYYIVKLCTNILNELHIMK